MKRMKKFLLAALLVLFNVFICSGEVWAEQYLIDFEDLEGGTIFTTTNQGYETLNAVEGHGIRISSSAAGVNPTVVTGTQAYSPYNTLVNVPTNEFGWSVNENIVIQLNGFTADYVRIFAGLADRDVCRVTAHLKAYKYPDIYFPALRCEKNIKY
ncbi:MAG TPA: hypothetical protein VJ946_05945 [Bacteroidales bacterium]|nr:hypothetical protein [Bacteroidales bacterium]